MRLKILTFNWHEAYIHLLAKTGYDFDVVERWKGGRYGWIKEFRPVPLNCRLISEEEARVRLDAGYYDRVICHNLQDFTLVSEYPGPKILLHHNKMVVETNIFDEAQQEELRQRLRPMYKGTKDLTLVFVSGIKKDSWGLDGEVILPGIDQDEYNGWKGDIEKVLRIGNFLKERDGMLGYSCQERILKEIPSTFVGLNPATADSLLPEDWEEYKEILRRHRVYLNTTLYPLEDGYNLAMLEAMATGMPVVSINNPTSPIEDGINGFVSDDENYLRKRIKELLRDHSLARSMGEKARETVMDRFPIGKFIQRWKIALGDSSCKYENYGRNSDTEMPARQASRPLEEKGLSPNVPVRKLKILMSYTANPLTTAVYMEKALRRYHDVITYGPCIDEDIIKKWDLGKIKDRIKEHDIPYFTADIVEMIQNLPSKWIPDLFLWVESGVWYPLEGFKNLPCPTACYLIDVHLSLERHLEFAKNFDYVFIAQKEYLPKFKEAGIERVFWLPLACDPDIHGKKPWEKIYDLSFIGSLNNQRRIDLLNKLKGRFNLYYGRCFLERMAEVFSQSKIVFNNSVNNDLNMRVFEALCSGSMLITDEARASGLTDLFEDKKHLVVYRDEDELMELAGYYLENDGERERIAEQGMKEVLNKHTYEHRVVEMLNILKPFLKENEQNQSPAIRPDNREPIDQANNGYYRQERREVEALVPEECLRILDVGCGEGTLGKRLLERGAKEVIGIEINPSAAKRAEENLTGVLCGDIETMMPPFSKGYFDCIIFADVLEHLREPLLLLNRYREYLSDEGVIVASIPNVRYHGVINMLIEGRWKYEDYGILDRTHLRFFTKKEISEMFQDAGFEITGITENLDPQYHNIDPLLRNISFGRVTLNGLVPDELKDLFVVQYLVMAQKSIHHRLDAGSGDLEEQRCKLEKYLETHQTDLDALYRYAKVCHKLGMPDKAVDSLEKILIFEPGREAAVKLKREIMERHHADKHL